MAFPVLPIKIDFMEWASQIRNDLSNLDIPNPESEAEWKKWAQQIINLNSLNNMPFPTNISYNDDEGWRQWACFFVDSVSNT